MSTSSSSQSKFSPSTAGSSTGPGAHVKLELQSNPLFLSGVRELISAVSKRLGFGDETSGQIALAVDEALCNVIRHGYQRQPDRPIWLSVFAEGGAWASGAPVATMRTCEEQPDSIRIVIEDNAPQVDPSTIKSRSLEEIRPGGLGVHIIKSVMDEAIYEKRAGGSGMRLTMVKRRPALAVCSAGGQGGESRHG